jgi:hypothetical protein
MFVKSQIACREPKSLLSYVDTNTETEGLKTMNLRKLNSMTRTLAVAGALLLAGGSTYQAAAQKFAHRPQANRFTQQSSNAAANVVFSGARDLIDDAQWARAEDQFAKYIAAYPKETNVDAAMYWMAYSQYKLRKFNQSKDTLDRLLKTYEKTGWRDEAELLLAQLPGTVSVKVDPVTVTVDPVVQTPPAAPVAIAGPAVPAVAPVVVAVPGQDPVEVKIRTDEMEARIAEAQARSQERVRESQERMQERIAAAKDKIKDKTIWKSDFDFDFNFDFDFDYDGMGKGIGKGKAGDDDPSEFKIVVLQALFESDPQRGIAVANEWLKPNSGQTPACRRAAVKLLARHGGKGVIPTILGVAQNDPDLKVRATAISMLGATNDESVIGPLRDFALNSTQNEISEAALYALGQHTGAGAANVLADVALSSKPVNIRRAAIRGIAGRPGEPAVDALIKIYDSSNEIDIRKAVIDGFSRRKSERAGTKLLEIARSSDNLELRKAAIGAIGRRGGPGALDALISLYDSASTDELKDQLMNAMSYSNDPRVTDKLISIARNPQTPIDRKRRAVMLLSSRSKDPKVLAFLEELLKQ